MEAPSSQGADSSTVPVLNKDSLHIMNSCCVAGLQWSETVDAFLNRQCTKDMVEEYFERGGEHLVLYHNLVAVKTKQQRLKAKFRGTKKITVMNDLLLAHHRY